MVGEMRTAFVFAGGGSLATVQVGMLDVLTAYGIRPNFVVGSSVGAINAAYFSGAPARLAQTPSIPCQALYAYVGTSCLMSQWECPAAGPPRGRRRNLPVGRLPA